jgi:hypothetical protein
MREDVSRIEPLLFEDAVPRVLADLVGNIRGEAATLGADLHPDSAAELAEFVVTGANSRLFGGSQGLECVIQAWDVSRSE